MAGGHVRPEGAVRHEPRRVRRPPRGTPPRGGREPRRADARIPPRLPVVVRRGEGRGEEVVRRRREAPRRARTDRAVQVKLGRKPLPCGRGSQSLYEPRPQGSGVYITEGFMRLRVTCCGGNYGAFGFMTAARAA